MDDALTTYIGTIPPPIERLQVGDEWQVPGGPIRRWNGPEWVAADEVVDVRMLGRLIHDAITKQDAGFSGLSIEETTRVARVVLARLAPDATPESVAAHMYEYWETAHPDVRAGYVAEAAKYFGEDD